MHQRILSFLFFLALCALIAVACQQRMTIKMSEVTPPTFSFEASTFTHYKYLTFFVVSEVAPENVKIPAYEKTPVEDKIVWWIFPGDSHKGEYKNLRAITYGELPSGWTQKVPEQGKPPLLVEGKVYEAGGPQIEVPDAVIRFTIRGGKAVRLPLYREEFENHQSQ